VGTAAPRRLTGRRSAAGLLLAASVVLSACGGSVAPLQTTSARGFPLGDLTVKRGGSTVLSLTVEIADTRAAREKGLMGVTKLTDQQGMAFVFPGMQHAAFWMKDTLIPLDIAFWDDAGAVVDTQAMTPCTADPCPIYNAAQPYSSAVEVRGGLFSKAGLRPGDVVQLARRAKAVSGSGSASP
jgi:uncharacterized membrane protein (UPF0127 family)